MPYGKRRYSAFSDTRPFVRVPGEGPMPCDVMLIGERPGENEARAGRPFIGISGQWLNIFLGIAGMQRREIYVTNLVKTYNEGEKPSAAEVERDAAELEWEIESVNPRVIGLMGTYAVEHVLGRERAGLERTHGVPVAWQGERLAVPMYHPAAGLYNQDAMPHVMNDVISLAMVAEGKLRPLEDIWCGKEDYGNEAEQTVEAVSAIDTEGSRARPWCLTYSTRPGQSFIGFPGICKSAFRSTVLLHNSLHDLSVLRTLGVDIAENQFIDTMALAYLLQLEPQGLKDLAYRHAGMTMQSYDEVINTGGADRDKAIEYLVGVSAVEWQPTEPYVAVVSGVSKVRRPHSINRRVAAILRDVEADKRDKDGNPVDPRKRWGQIEDYVKQEVVGTLGDMLETTLDDVPRATAEHYACRDSDATLRIAPVLEAKIDQMGLRGVAEIDHAIIPMVDRMMEVGVPLAGEEYWNALEAECDAIKSKAKYDIFKSTGWEINPDSAKQTRELIYGELKLPVSKYTDGGEASTKDKALEAIVSLHPVVDMVLTYREASKVISSFVNPLRAIVRRAGGAVPRAHCNMRITRVVSGRLSATSPNLLAIPVRSDLGKKVRYGFRASEGRALGDWDLNQIEMRWMANESRCQELIKIFIAGDRDVHRETAARMFSVSVGNVATEQRYAAKRVGFGVITGITEYGLVDQMALARAKRPDGEAWTVDDCAMMIRAWFDMYPEVEDFIDAAGNEAAENGFVRDKWGRIRYLPGIWSPIPAVAAEARRQASSFKIQAGAQGYMKRAQKKVWDNVCKVAWLETEPLLQVYDELLMDVPGDETRQAIVGSLMVECMQGTLDQGVPVIASGGIGASWAEAKD